MRYKDLFDHYSGMLEMFDAVHFNSTVAESIYGGCVPLGEASVISITHSNIIDRRVAREFTDSKLNLIFIGGSSFYKGLPMLERILCEIYDVGNRNVGLDIWGSMGKSSCKLIRYNGSYTSLELSKVFAKDSLLVVPSIWSETFGLVVVEALSFGIPVICSSTVGAKDIVGSYDPWFIFHDEDQLKDKIIELIEDRDRLVTFNRAIVEGKWSHSQHLHSNEIFKLYNR